MDAARLRSAYSSSAGQAPFVGQALLELSHCKARLPLRNGGLGHTSAVLLSPIAFYSQYARHAFLERDRGARDRLLLTELNFAYISLSTLLPPPAIVNLTSLQDFAWSEPDRKMQRDLTLYAHKLAVERLSALSPFACDKLVLMISARQTDSFFPFLVCPITNGLVLLPGVYLWP